MKKVSPITVLVLGSAGIAMAMSVGAWFGLHTLSGVLLFFGAGAAGGLVMFGPIAAMMVLRARHPEWIGRHYFQIQWYVTLPMALALGYFAACIRHGIFDALTAISMGLVGLGAILKIGLSDWAQGHANLS